ncbi:hypothetical protein C8R32_10269 [Nitrosospira sp. Nsp5]|uniref:Uncharacterized protein n=1 Tax=Nitrosospira multiformis TaxID=1231 RepID=A0ABY0TL20_9PROT|nr:hypothetical protein C8R32_10269 [Nitrosospira sp. Nsp5]SDQ99965.1 hypothetical protein SAMN05216402_3189 [Nitrosospira multiformis]
MKHSDEFLTLVVEVQGVLIRKIPPVFRCRPDGCIAISIF